MSELSIRVRKLQDNGSTFRATPDTLYLGGIRSAKVDTLRFELPEEWAGCAVTLHVQRLSGTLPDPQLLDDDNCVVVDRRWTLEKQGMWMLLAAGEGGYIAMTKPGQYTCYETIDTDSTTETIDPSVYEQFVELVRKSRNEAVSSAEQAKESEKAAAGSAAAAKESETHSAESKRAAAESARQAAESEAAAQASKAAAATSEANALKYSKEAGAKAGTDKTLSIPDAPADAKETGDQLALRYTKEQVDALLAQVKKETKLEDHPKGSLFFSDDPTSPAEIFGGTWEQIKDRFILAAGDTYAAGSMGGEAKHTLTINEMPSHRLETHGIGVKASIVSTSSDDYVVMRSQLRDNVYGSIEYTSIIGNDQPHNNLPPYITKYVWQRIE